VAIITTVTIGLALILWIVIYLVSKKNKNSNKLNYDHSGALSQSSLKTAATALNKKPINESNDKSTDGYDSDFN
jgi:cytoskeletal protein RodZ